MKKLLSFLLALVLLLALTACGQSEAAKAVDAQIEAIGEVTLESEAQISAAERAVDRLEETDRKQLKNVGLLEDARESYEALVLAAKVAEVEAVIDGIGTVTRDSQDVITAAREVFENSEAAVRDGVSNLGVLEAAEAAYKDLLVKEVEDVIAAIGTVTLDSGDAITAAREAFENSEAEIRASVSNLGVLEAAEAEIEDLRVRTVEDLIAAIGEVTENSGELIRAAQAGFDGLSSENAARVSNTQVLTDAQSAFQAIRMAQAQALLEKFRLEDDPVRGMKFYNSETQPYYADVRSYVFPYIGMNNKDQIWLCAQFHYTGDDWVFFKKITFAVDGKNTVKTFSYFKDIVRDNQYGNVWEYVNTGDGNQYEDLFWTIADSESTIVRFEGDNYWYDLTVSQKDKDAIREVLTAYAALRDAGYKEIG